MDPLAFYPQFPAEQIWSGCFTRGKNHIHSYSLKPMGKTFLDSLGEAALPSVPAAAWVKLVPRTVRIQQIKTDTGQMPRTERSVQ